MRAWRTVTAVCEFIRLLADLDAQYPPECTIGIILDNHSANRSKRETHAFLSLHPNPVSVRAHTEAWLLAEHRRGSIWQNDPYLPAAYPSAIS